MTFAEAETMAMRGATAATKPALLLDLLPWCGTLRTSLWTGSMRASAPSSMSPVSRKRILPKVSSSTTESSLRVVHGGGPMGFGQTTRTSIPSHWVLMPRVTVRRLVPAVTRAVFMAR